MKKLRFRDGSFIPSLGLGTWKSTGEEIKKVIKDAINIGYKHIDTAAAYGNEAAIGEALKEIFSEGRIKREDLFITTKLWNDSHEPQYVIPALKESLEKLQLDYVDLYLIHWPVAFRHGVSFPTKPEDFIKPADIPYSVTWKEMEAAKESGLTKHIGVSNFSIPKLKEVIESATILPEMNQIELHPFLQQKEMFDFCTANQILLTAYSPLGSGDRPEHNKRNDEPNMFQIPEIISIAKKHDVHPIQVLLAWHVNRNTAVIPKSTNLEHMESNLKAADLYLDEDDMLMIAALDRHYRYIDGTFFERPEVGIVNIYDE